MSYPVGWDLVNITGTYVGRNGVPCVGSVTLSSPQLVLRSGTIVPAADIVFDLVNGVFSGQIPATDDPNASPVGWTYTVTENVPGGRQGYQIVAPHTSPGIDLSTVIPVTMPMPPTFGFPYVTLAQLASTATGQGIALIGWPAGFGITQAATNQFFEQNGAAIHRFNDRIFLGGATVNDGYYPTVVKDWLTNFYDANGYTLGYTLNGQFSVLSSQSSASSEMVVSGVQSQYFPGNGSYGTAFYGVGVNNGATYTGMGINAFYGEVHNTASNLNSAYVCEFDTRTTVDPSIPTPYNQGTVVGIQLASGAGTSGVTFTGSISGTTLTVASLIYALPYGNVPQSYQIKVGSKLYGVGIPAGTTVTALGTGTGETGTYTISTSLTVASETMVATDQYDASCALQIEANPVKFKVGINFGAMSIAGCDGVNGAGTAIALALGHQLNWYNSSGAVIGRIYSLATAQANTGEIQFNDLGIELRSFAAGGGAISYFKGVANGVNYLSVTNAATGTPVTITATGSDANVDLSLACLGTGVVRFGTYTAGTVTQAGYITIKDIGGTVRRLLVG